MGNPLKERMVANRKIWEGYGVGWWEIDDGIPPTDVRNMPLWDPSWVLDYIEIMRVGLWFWYVD